MVSANDGFFSQEELDVIISSVAGIEIESRWRCEPPRGSRLVYPIGISFEPSAPDTHEQNGGAERMGRTILTKARAMRISAVRSQSQWRGIAQAAAYLHKPSNMTFAGLEESARGL